ncbi:MAG: metal ABC transporter permease [Deltaproteobacteria bacterium]|nr:metal ABC transporter permease [Deltaproteobacteria bacterium]
MPPLDSAPTWDKFIAGLPVLLDPILCAAAAGLVLGLIGVYVVLRRMVFVSAAITHAAGLGVALSFYVQIHLGLGALAHPVVGAFVCGILATLLLLRDPARLRLTRESLLGLVFIGAAGATLLVGSRISQESHDINAILFGSAVLVSAADLYTTLVVGGIVLAGHLWLRRAFVYVSFDKESARVHQLPVRTLETALLVSVGLMVSVTTRALGAMPVFAFNVLPAMGALALCRRVETAFVAAGLFGLLSGAAGYVASYFFRLPVGASQTVTAALLALLAMGVRFVRR